jgi:hypothetical protein
MYLPTIFFNLGDHLIVLGDVLLRTSTKQLLLVHQPHLQDPKVNEFVGRSAVFRAMRMPCVVTMRFILMRNQMKV